MRHMNWADKLIPWPLWDSFAERALVPKSKDASLIPRTHRTDGENRSRSFDLLYAGCASHTHKYTTELNVKESFMAKLTVIYSNHSHGFTKTPIEETSAPLRRAHLPWDWLAGLCWWLSGCYWRRREDHTAVTRQWHYRTDLQAWKEEKVKVTKGCQL